MIKKILGFTLILVLVCLFVWRVSAQTQKTTDLPTVVVGEAQNANGSENVFVVAQPSNSENPLGNPIDNLETTNNDGNANTDEDNVRAQSNDNANKQVIQPQNAEQAGKDFENTLLEANGRVYDVQSYPEGDLPIMSNSANPDTIYSPNVNP